MYEIDTKRITRGSARAPARYVVATGVFFGVIAVLQAVRALNQWPVHIGTLEIPVWASWMAMVVAGGFCAWASRCTGK